MGQRPRKALDSPSDIGSTPTGVRPDVIFNGFYEKSASVTIV